jgi:PAT family acetyl-CoA transporter-like MFS transporter 1
VSGRNNHTVQSGRIVSQLGLSRSIIRSCAALTLITLHSDCLQGVPLGLCLGSVPFLLQQSVSYTALGYFSLCSWPYSLKLLWSPVVDSWYWEKMGRRKSWIVPIQCIIGFMLIGYSY